MTAALKSQVAPMHSPLPTPPRRREMSQVRKEKYQAAIARLPAPPPPLWLRLLLVLQRSSTPIAILLVVGVLPLYGWSVYTQRSWGKAFVQLEELQRNERQLMTANETRKYDLTEQTERSPKGLVRQVPANTLFLKPAAPRPAKPVPTTVMPTSPAHITSPVGY